MQGPGMDIISRGPAAQSPLIFGKAPKFWEKKIPWMAVWNPTPKI